MNGKLIAAALAAFPIAACGGSGGSSVSSTPVPNLQPDAEFVEPIALEESQSLVVLTREGSETEITLRYDADQGVWLMSYPAVEEGRILKLNEYPHFWHGAIVDDKGEHLGESTVDISRPSADNPDSNVTSGSVYSAAGLNEYSTSFVAAVPTVPGDMPVTGTAAFAIVGSGWSTYFDGEMRFDFAQGTLAGEIDAHYADAWYGYELGQFTMAETVFGVGSTRFSGLFVKDGDPSSSGNFFGLFAGPEARELIGHFSLTIPDFYTEGATFTDQGLFTGIRN